MKTIQTAAATVSMAVAALGLTGPASAGPAADPVPAGGHDGTVLTACTQPGPAGFDYDAYIAFRKAQLSLQRAARP